MQQIKQHFSLAIKLKLSFALNLIHAWYQHLCLSSIFNYLKKQNVSFIIGGDTINHILAV